MATSVIYCFYATKVNSACGNYVNLNTLTLFSKRNVISTWSGVKGMPMY